MDKPTDVNKLISAQDFKKPKMRTIKRSQKQLIFELWGKMSQAYEPWFQQNHGPEPTEIWLTELQFVTKDQIDRAFSKCRAEYPSKAPTAFQFKNLIVNPEDWQHSSPAYQNSRDPESQAYRPKLLQSDEHVSKNKKAGNTMLDQLRKGLK